MRSFFFMYRFSLTYIKNYLLTYHVLYPGKIFKININYSWYDLFNLLYIIIYQDSYFYEITDKI